MAVATFGSLAEQAKLGGISWDGVRDTRKNRPTGGEGALGRTIGGLRQTRQHGLRGDCKEHAPMRHFAQSGNHVVMRRTSLCYSLAFSTL